MTEQEAISILLERSDKCSINRIFKNKVFSHFSVLCTHRRVQQTRVNAQYYSSRWKAYSLHADLCRGKVGVQTGPRVQMWALPFTS